MFGSGAEHLPTEWASGTLGFEEICELGAAGFLVNEDMGIIHNSLGFFSHFSTPSC